MRKGEENLRGSCKVYFGHKAHFNLEAQYERSPDKKYFQLGVGRPIEGPGAQPRKKMPMSQHAPHGQIQSQTPHPHLWEVSSHINTHMGQLQVHGSNLGLGTSTLMKGLLLCQKVSISSMFSLECQTHVAHPRAQCSCHSTTKIPHGSVVDSSGRAWASRFSSYWWYSHHINERKL